MNKQIKPIPDGYHSINIYIPVRNAAHAIQFYKEAFRAQEKSRYDLPDGRIMFAEIRIGDSTLQISEEFPQHEFNIASPHLLKGRSCIIHLYVENADAIFESAIKAGAIIKSPLSDMFNGDRYGQLEDPFGHLWSISTRIKNVSAEKVNEGFSQLIKNITQMQSHNETRQK